MTPHWEVLPRRAIELIPKLGALLGTDYYLAGGTGLALQAGHRRSVDFDFFRTTRTLKLPGKAALKAGLKSLPAVKFGMEDEATLYLTSGETRISVMAYQPPLLEQTQPLDGLHLAGPVDIGLMKLSALIDRGAKKDFIDLAWIIRERLPLVDLLAFSPRKFPDARDFPMLALRSLAFFEKAEPESDPVVLDPRFQWSPVKKFILAEVKKAAKF